MISKKFGALGDGVVDFSWWSIGLTARRVASFRLAESPISSSSAAETQPVALAKECCLIRSYSLSRCFGVSFFESVSWISVGKFSPKITAPTTSGPAQGPRPTSSIPKTICDVSKKFNPIRQVQLDP